MPTSTLLRSIALPTLAVAAILASVGIAAPAGGAPETPSTTIVTPFGTPATLPPTVVRSTAGAPKAAPVTWSAIDPGVFEKAGDHTVAGRLSDGTAVEGIVRVAAKNATIKVAAVGDSITWGAGTINAVTNSYPGQLGAMLGSAYAVTNYGVSGYAALSRSDAPYITTGQYAQSKQANPDAVLIQLGTNDAKPWNWAFKDAFVSDYRAILRSYLTLPSRPAVYAMLPPSVMPGDAMGFTNATMNEVITKILESVSTKEFSRVTVIDNHTRTASATAEYPDRVHPNSEGALSLATGIRAALAGDTQRRHSGKLPAASLTSESGMFLYPGSSDESGMWALRSMNTGEWVSYSGVDLKAASARPLALRVAVPTTRASLCASTHPTARS